MSGNIRDFVNVLIAIMIFLCIGAVISFVFYNLKKKDLFGGFIGGMVVGFLGASIIGSILNAVLDYKKIVPIVCNYLWEGAGVNIFTGIIGAYIALYILNRLNHDRSRKKF